MKIKSHTATDGSDSNKSQPKVLQGKSSDTPSSSHKKAKKQPAKKLQQHK